MSSLQTEICVLGSGVWGTAIASQIDRNLGSCKVFTKTIQTFNDINNLNSNKGFEISKNITAEIDFNRLANYQNIVIASPSYAFYEVLEIIKSLPASINLIIATKGLDVQKVQLLSQTLQQEAAHQTMILSGASFADEVINNEFTKINLAAHDLTQATQTATLFSSSNFIVIPCDEVVALQLSGCMKNVIAILVGILRGLGYGDNLCSAITSKGIEEIQKLTKIMDPKASASCLSIASDIILCCSSKKSRNMSFGMELAGGLASGKKLTEGSLAAKAILDLAAKHNFSSPLLELAYECIERPAHLKEKIDKAMVSLFLR